MVPVDLYTILLPMCNGVGIFPGARSFADRQNTRATTPGGPAPPAHGSSHPSPLLCGVNQPAHTVGLPSNTPVIRCVSFQGVLLKGSSLLLVRPGNLRSVATETSTMTAA